MNAPLGGSALEVADLTVTYGDAVALDGIDLTIDHGEVVAVVGPSGSGKSTLLRAVAGLEPVARGRIMAGGRDLNGVPVHERGLGMMFQEHALFPHETVEGNISFGLRLAGVRPAEQRQRTRELLEMVGLRGFESRNVAKLSGGEAQRVALARSLAPSPRLLMLDEPLGSLDRLRREQLTADLRMLLSGVAVSALHVTHDQSEAFAVADRILVLDQGRIVQEGTPEELWHRPVDRFVAEFFGHPNVWEFSEQVVMVPITALHPVEECQTGDLSIQVIDAQFVEGRYRVSGLAEDRQVVFFADRRPQLGDPMWIRIDSSEIRQLS